MPVARKPAQPMIPLDPAHTVKRRSLRTGRMEKWAATSKDGRWFFQREESTGTPWLIWRRDPGTGALMGEGPTGGPWATATSLPQARRQVAAHLAAQADAA